jgi:small-conductance mechanosensitive channel
VLASPAPETAVLAYTERGVTLNVRCWTASGDFWPMQCALYERIKPTLEQAGCAMAVPVQNQWAPVNPASQPAPEPPRPDSTRANGRDRLTPVPRG